MKNKFFYLFFCLSFLFVGCDTFFNNVVSEMIDYSVQAFNEDSVILRWDSDTKDARFNIYVKDKDDQVKCLEKKYAKSNYFAVCDSGSSYAVGIIKNGSEIVGNHVKVKVVKNKVAPPFKRAEFDIMFGEGISKSGEIIDLGVEYNIIQKSGSWFSYDGSKLAQGRDAAKRVISDNPELAEELEEKIDDKEEKPFKLTYADNGALYIAVGYGEQKTSGYSIKVTDLYETENAIYIHTSLIGPAKDEKIVEEETYPYIVIKLEYIDKNVVFE